MHSYVTLVHAVAMPVTVQIWTRTTHTHIRPYNMKGNRCTLYTPFIRKPLTEEDGRLPALFHNPCHVSCRTRNRRVSNCSQVTIALPLGASVYPTATTVAPCLVRGTAATPACSTLHHITQGTHRVSVLFSLTFHFIVISTLLLCSYASSLSNAFEA